MTPHHQDVLADLAQRARVSFTPLKSITVDGEPIEPRSFLELFAADTSLCPPELAATLDMRSKLTIGQFAKVLLGRLVEAGAIPDISGPKPIKVPTRVDALAELARRFRRNEALPKALWVGQIGYSPSGLLSELSTEREECPAQIAATIGLDPGVVSMREASIALHGRLRQQGRL